MVHQQGFTLIELLIILAVVVILVFLIIPSLIDARDKAHDTATRVYGRNMLNHVTAWLADNPGYRVSDLRSNCLDAIYISEGGESSFPIAVAACEVQNLGADAYGIKATSRTGNVFRFRN